MSSELRRVDELIIQKRPEPSTMASLSCTACAVLSSSRSQGSAVVWKSGAVGAGVKNFGSFAGSGFASRGLSNAGSKGLGQGVGLLRLPCGLFRLSPSSSSSSSNAGGGVSLRWGGGGSWFGNPLSDEHLYSLTFRQNFEVRASRRNFLFQVGDDGGYEEGPIELPPRELEMDPLAIPEASPLQIVASLVLTGTIAVLLVRSLRRRAQRAKEMTFRSSGVATKASIKEEARKAAIANLTKAPEVPVAPPSAVQTLFGAAVAGVIALLLYRVTTTVEGSFVGKPVSMNYSIRNLTITVRTIINGMLYLATFVFAANSIGLGLYSLQLLWGDDPSPDPPRVEPLEKRESSSDTERSSEAEDTD